MARRASQLNRLWRWCRRNRALATSISAANVATVLVAVVSTWSYFSERDLNDQVSTALCRAKTSLQQEQEQRRKAENTSAIAWEALDEIFVRFAPRRVDPGAISADDDSLSIRPALSTKAAEVLENLPPYYNQLAEQGDDSSAHRQRIADAHRRVGDIYQRLEKYELAEQSYRRAVEMFDAVTDAGRASGQASCRAQCQMPLQ